jgi:hypothetical protein
MTATALTEPPASDDAPDTQPSASHLLDQLQAGLPPLLSVVPQAGPPVYVYAGFGVVLLLLLVPPLTLLATVVGVALVMAAALVALGVLAVAIVEAPFLLVRFLRGHRLRHFSLPVPHLRKLKARRV